MKKLEIQLTESVNGVAFGTDRTVVRHAFGNDYAEFKKRQLKSVQIRL